MPNQSAVCIHCGQFKPRALGACGACGFVPSSAEDQARSLMLSPFFDAGENVIGLAPAELKRAAELIQNGNRYTFEPKTLAQVIAHHAAARAITPRQLVIDLVRWLLPPLLVLAAAFWLLARK
jgi:predicted ATP-dependent serine protease